MTIVDANPLAIDFPSNLEYLKKQRAIAIEMPSSRTNFLVKHMNIFVQGDEGEIYIPVENVKKCSIDSYDWHGRDVYVGVDLSLTTDNTAVSMVTYDWELKKFVAKSWGFLPADNAVNKSKVEKIDYFRYREEGYCFFCGDNVIDHNFVENFVIDLQQKYGVRIVDIGYDRYNCIASANRWYDKGLCVTAIKQHSSVLHPATKVLKEIILKQEFLYEHNELLEINFANAKEVLDTNLNGYINKKKSTGKIDMVASLINAMVFWEKEFAEGVSVYERDRGEHTFIVL